MSFLRTIAGAVLQTNIQQLDYDRIMTKMVRAMALATEGENEDSPAFKLAALNFSLGLVNTTAEQRA